MREAYPQWHSSQTIRLGLRRGSRRRSRRRLKVWRGGVDDVDPSFSVRGLGELCDVAGIAEAAETREPARHATVPGSQVASRLPEQQPSLW